MNTTITGWKRSCSRGDEQKEENEKPIHFSLRNEMHMNCEKEAKK